jgi:hypothetical protein
MSNDLKHALGNAPNSEFVVDPQGKIVRVRSWSRPNELREDLETLVGSVDKVTTVAELKMKRLAPVEKATTGVVARVRLPGRMMPVKVEPLDSGTDPFYAKLRAEVEPRYFQENKGTLYLGFFLDPLYQVHWNNETPPIQYEIQTPAGVELNPASGTGPEVQAKADADPREFLVDVTGKSSLPIELTVKYIACDDAETFCKPVTQHYRVFLERDPDGGSRRAAGRNRPSSTGPPGGRSANAMQGPSMEMFRNLDSNRDGKLTKDELPERMRQRWAMMDTNGDGAVDAKEQQAVLQRIQRMRGNNRPRR